MPRHGGEICDVAETCDGINNACPADAVLPNGTSCRASAGACDAAEVCDGTSTLCPSDAKSTATCRAAAGTCDVAEACDGVNDACPADAFEPATTVCRPSNGGEVCDIPESCTGSGPTCPADAVQPNTTLCRAAAGVCDLAETCDGTTKTCPADAVEPSSTVCRAASSGETCDATETCDGATVTCPADAVLPNGTTCRASAGVCDVTEACDGASKLCPSDAKSTAVCRSAVGVCDVAESCDGVNDACPSDAFVTDGTSCDDTLYCNGTQTCTGGVCGGGSSPCAMGQSCDETGNVCFTGDCPVSPSSLCRTAAKNKVLIKNKADNGKDKLIWKWTKGAATTQTEFGDPTTTANYALCFYAGATPALLQSGDRAAGRRQVGGARQQGLQVQGPRRHQRRDHQDHPEGRRSGKSKALVKGKGAALPDFDSDLPIPNGNLPLIVQLRNNQNGICWQGSFAIPKKNLADQFSAKQP